MSSLQGQVAIVTGGSRGIGAACSRLLASRGVRVILSYLNQADRAEKLVAEIRQAGGDALAVQSDIRDSEQIRLLFEQTVATYDRIDIVVSNAPVGYVGKSFREISWEEYRSVVDGELKAAFEVTKATRAAMTAQRHGRLIYISSGLAKHHPIPGKLASATAKVSLSTFVRYIAEELGSSGITANAVAPGLVETEMNQDMPKEEKAQIAAMTPLRRVAGPEDIARVVAFLAGEDGGFLTGLTIPVNGGLVMD
ncbi:MAG: SDR family oxidoreductase [Anaerolineales bacterium]